MKPGLISRVEKVLVAAEAELGLVDAPLTLFVLVVGGDDAEEAKSRVLAEHLAEHPQDAGRPIEWELYKVVFVEADPAPC